MWSGSILPVREGQDDFSASLPIGKGAGIALPNWRDESLRRTGECSDMQSLDDLVANWNGHGGWGWRVVHCCEDVPTIHFQGEGSSSYSTVLFILLKHSGLTCPMLSSHVHSHPNASPLSSSVFGTNLPCLFASAVGAIAQYCSPP